MKPDMKIDRMKLKKVISPSGLLLNFIFKAQKLPGGMFLLKVVCTEMFVTRISF